MPDSDRDARRGGGLRETRNESRICGRAAPRAALVIFDFPGTVKRGGGSTEEGGAVDE